MPYRKNSKARRPAADRTKNVTASGLPAGTRVSITLEPSGPPDPFGDEFAGGILAGSATLVLETSTVQDIPVEERLLTSQVIESKLKELAHTKAKSSTVRTYSK